MVHENRQSCRGEKPDKYPDWGKGFGVRSHLIKVSKNSQERKPLEMLQPQEKLKSELTPSSTPKSVERETQICRNPTSLATALTEVLVKLFTALRSSPGWRQHGEHPTSTSVLPSKRLFCISPSGARKERGKVCQHTATEGRQGRAGADVPTGCYTDPSRAAERVCLLVCSDAKSHPLALPAAAAGPARSALPSQRGPRRVSLCTSCSFITPQSASCTHRRMTTSFCPRKASLNSPFLTKSLVTSSLALAHKLPVLILAYSSTYSLVHHSQASSHFSPLPLFSQPFSDISLHIMLSGCSLNGFLPLKNSISKITSSNNSILKRALAVKLLHCLFKHIHDTQQNDTVLILRRTCPIPKRITGYKMEESTAKPYGV